MNKGHVRSAEIINLETLKGDMDVDASHALIKTEDMEVIRMALPKGKEIGEHSVDGEVSIQCLRGHIQFKLGDIKRNLSEGDWMYLEEEQAFSYVVQSNTILLVTILFLSNSDK